MNDSSSIFAGRMWAEEELRLQRMEELSAELRILWIGDSAKRDRLSLEIEFLLEESIIPEDD